MSEGKDLFKILELEKTATDEDITKSYKKLAKKYHPDKNGGSEESTIKFKEIAEAYEILTNPEKRKIYDKYGYEGLKENGNPPNNVNPLDLFAHMMQNMGMQMSGMQMFGEFPGFNMGSRNSNKQSQEQQQEDIDSDSELDENSNPMINQSEEHKNIVSKLELTLEDLYAGKIILKDVERLSECKKCKMTGLKEHVQNQNLHKCKNCKGRGLIITPIGMGMKQKMMCNKCVGTGINDSFRCVICKGKKICMETHSVVINVIAGSYNEMPIIIENEGNYISNDVRTNVIFVIEEKEHEKYKRTIDNKSDLNVDMEISIYESFFGFTKNLLLLDNTKITIKITEPIRHNDKFVVKKYGMPNIEGKQKGNLIINITTSHPKLLTLTPENKQKLSGILIDKSIKKSHIVNQVELIDYNIYKEEMLAQETQKHYDNRRKQKANAQPMHNMNQNVRVQECAQQ